MSCFRKPCRLSYCILPSSMSHLRALPNDFKMKIDNLNKQSMKSHELKLDRRILLKTPEEYHDVIKRLDIEIKEDIDYILVMYEPPIDERRNAMYETKLSI